jgi:hypothetical protein
MERRDERVADETMLVPGDLGPYNGGELVPQASPAAVEAYRKEPLFSKKVMIGWGVATLIVWFTLSFVVPAVVQSVKTAIVSNIGEPEKTPTGETVFKTRRGIVTIRRTPTGIIIDRQEPGAAAAAPSLPEPVVAPVVVGPPPAPAPEATGKK